MDAPKLTGLKKRQQIQQANKTMFMWVIAGAVALAICLVLSQFMVRQLMYNNKVIGEKTKAQQTLDRNLTAFEELKKVVGKLNADPNLNTMRANDADSVLQFIIDALPTSDDRAGLGTSLQQVVLAPSGVGIESISVTQQGLSVVPGAETSTLDSKTPTEINFDIVLAGTYEQINTAVRDMERSIRPINVTGIKIEGNGKSLRATIAAKTYYLPGKTIELSKKAVQP